MNLAVFKLFPYLFQMSSRCGGNQLAHLCFTGNQLGFLCSTERVDLSIIGRYSIMFTVILLHGKLEIESRDLVWL